MIKKLILAFVGLGTVILLSYLAVTNSRWGQDFLLNQAVKEMASGDPGDNRFDGLEVLVCGSSSPLTANSGRAQSCIMVRAGNRLFLVDVGPGSIGVLQSSQAPLNLLQAVFLTHFHSDHISALYDVNLASWVAGRPNSIQVIGPAGVERVVDGFNTAFALDREYRVTHHGADLLSPEVGVLQSLTVQAGKVFEKDGLQVFAFEVDHKPIEPAFGYRFEYKGRSVAVSGDTIVNESFEAGIRRVDLLLIDALSETLITTFADAAEDAGATRRAQILRDVLDYHANTFAIDGLEKRLDIKQVALYHLVPVPANSLMEKVFMRGMRSNAILTKDGDRFLLPGNSDELQIIQ